MASVKTKTQAKRPHIECDSDKVHHSRIKRKTTADKTIPLHHRKKYFSSNNTPNCKNLKNGTILVEVTEKKQAEIMLKQKKNPQHRHKSLPL